MKKQAGIEPACFFPVPYGEVGSAQIVPLCRSEMTASRTHGSPMCGRPVECKSFVSMGSVMCGRPVECKTFVSMGSVRFSHVSGLLSWHCSHWP